MEGILLIEHSAVFQIALRSVLSRSGFTVCVPPQHKRMPAEAIKVVLVDAITLTLSPEQFELLVKEYSQVGPILLLAREDHAEQVIAGLRGGAMGFLKQTASPKQLKEAISSVASGRTWCDADLLRLVSKFLPLIPALRMARFTNREREVLDYVKCGLTNKEVGRRLGITEQSVKVYVSNLMRKTGANNRHELAYAP